MSSAYHFDSIKNLVTTMRENKCHSSRINFARLAAGQPGMDEQDIREEFLRQEQKESLTPVSEQGVDE